MADKKSIGGLNDAVETLNADNAKSGIESNELLGNINAGIQDLYGVNSQMLEVMSALQSAMAPDAFGAAQSTEANREGAGAPIVGGPAEASTVAPVEQKKGTSKLAMLGVAAAGAAAGLVAAFAGFLDFDAQKVKDKVLILTSIADEVDANDTAETVATLATLGIGLAAFGVGSVANGIAQSFMKKDWAKGIVASVTDLVKIGELPFSKALKGAANLTTIGVGLAAFGLTSGLGALGMGLTESMLKEGWAQKILDSVTTLVQIGDLSFLKAVKAAASLGTIGAGLAVFGVGSAVGGAGQAIADTMNSPGWAQGILDSVTTLVKIGDLSFLAAIEAAGSLKVLGAGLAIFGVGSAVASIAAPGFAQGIVDSVKTLTTVKDQITEKEATSFKKIMKELSKGMLVFSGSSFISSLLDGATGILNFFTGGKSPIEQMLGVADREADLNKGADALDRIRGALTSLSSLKFDGGDLGIEKFAEDLLKSIPLIETAIMGGKIDGGILPWADDIEFKGLASGDIKYAEAVKNIESLRKALGAEVSSSSGASSAGSSSGVPDFVKVPVSPDTGASLKKPADIKIEETGLTVPYDRKERVLRARQLAKELGLGNAKKATYEGNIPTSVDGLEVPTWLYTDDEIAAINGARSMRASMNNTTPTLIPTRQSGQGLQTAQAEANANGTNGQGNSMVQVNNSAPTAVNNNSNTQVAMRNQHHKPDNLELQILGVF